MVCEVFVVGMGMGNPDTLTVVAREALDHSELLLGAPRLLQALDAYDVPKLGLVAAGDIVDALRATNAHTASVVMSGDVGLYSGATALYPLLDQLEGVRVQVIPGVSSLQYFCAALRTPWQDAHVVSVHGRQADVAGAVQSHAKTFVLTGGATRAGDVCVQLAKRGLGDLQVAVGERLSYADERIVHGTAAQLAGQAFDGLAVMLVQNDQPLQAQDALSGLPDDVFIRGKVPMTKREVRTLAISRLGIRPDSVVWDVGAGTGSVSVEAARAAYAGQVIAIEQNGEALDLLEQNRAAFGLSNLRIVAGTAPEALTDLPVPDCVFVGGSSGNLQLILQAALEANPTVRLCVAAVTLETLAQAVDCASTLPLTDVDVVQASIARSREAGRYHLMQANNPVYLICAQGAAASDSDSINEEA